MVNARLLEQKQEKVHRVGSLVLIPAILLGLGFLLWYGGRLSARALFSQNDQFRIRRLVVHTDGRLKTRHVREYAHIGEDDNLFSIDLGDIRRRLESVPLIKDVTIRRHLPDTLEVQIEERVPMARLGRGHQPYHLAVDREGYVLGPSSRSPHLPAIAGYRRAGLRPGSYIGDPYFQDALRVLDVCDASRIGDSLGIRSIDVGHPDYLLLTLEDGARIYLPRHDHENRLKKLDQIVRVSRSQGRRIASVDMTVSKNFPVKYR